MEHPLVAALVHLESWEHAWTTHVGEQRHLIRNGTGDARHYDSALLEDNLTASIAAACVEMAVAKYKAAYWSGSVWPIAEHDLHCGSPDVEPNYEVRRVREPGNSVAVRRRDVKAGRIIVAGWGDRTVAFQDVYLIGQIPAAEGWLYGQRAPYDPMGTRLVPQACLSTYGHLTKAGSWAS